VSHTIRSRSSERSVPNQSCVTLDSVKKRAAELNANGKIVRKFGIKRFVHNRTGEFEELLDSDQMTYHVLLAETDQELVVMQPAMGWVYVTGRLCDEARIEAKRNCR
jgi:hypothetical protein